LWPKRLPAPESWIIAETFLVSSFSFLVPNVEGHPAHQKPETVYGFPSEHNGSPITIFIQLSAGMDK